MRAVTGAAWSVALFAALLAVAFSAAYWLGGSVGPVGPADPPPPAEATHGDMTHSMEQIPWTAR